VPPGRHLCYHGTVRAFSSGMGRLVIRCRKFHDVEGDRASGKRTLPLVLGEAHVWLMSRDVKII
jgi:1,4-dihydroxy-2-naphthoate octaprenyltransferase